MNVDIQREIFSLKDRLQPTLNEMRKPERVLNEFFNGLEKYLSKCKTTLKGGNWHDVEEDLVTGGLGLKELANTIMPDVEKFGKTFNRWEKRQNEAEAFETEQ